MGKEKINLGLFYKQGFIVPAFLFFVMFVFNNAGCFKQNVEFVPTNDYSVIGKRDVDINIDVRDFIKPEETEKVVEGLNISNKDIDGKIESIFRYVCGLNNIKEKQDFWQYPRETLQKGGGDCEDIVFLLLSILIQSGVKDCYAIKGRYLGGGHFWVECGNKILDPSARAGKIILKDKAIGYTAFFKFDNKDIFINKDI